MLVVEQRWSDGRPALRYLHPYRGRLMMIDAPYVISPDSEGLHVHIVRPLSEHHRQSLRSEIFDSLSEATEFVSIQLKKLKDVERRSLTTFLLGLALELRGRNVEPVIHPLSQAGF